MTNPVVQSDANKGVLLFMLSLPIRRFRTEKVSDSRHSKIQSKDFYPRFSPGFRRNFEA